MRDPLSHIYLEHLKIRYCSASRREKTLILDEFTKTTGYTRKHAIHVLRGNYQYHQGPIHRPHRARYTLADAGILKKVCTLLDWINSKRLQPQLDLAIESLVEAGELHITEEHKHRLIRMSPATIDRLLTRYKQRPVGKGHSYTKPGTLLKTHIPIRTFADWNEEKVGFCEIDLVGHDGGRVQGDFAWTLNLVDVHTQWTEQVAVKNKAQVHVFAGIQRIRARLPFPLLGIDSDSGTEFINDQLYRYCMEEHITFTRARAGKKNDQAHIEQKNDSIVRHWIGYGRYETQEQRELLNAFYEILRLYTNFFLPVQKLLRKERRGSKVTKIYDKAKTPYQRILEESTVGEEVKDRLQVQYATLHVVHIKRQLDTLLLHLHATPFE